MSNGSNRNKLNKNQEPKVYSLQKSQNDSELEIVELTKEQKAMLEMSEQDIKNGNLIPQEEMEERNPEWLNAM